VTSCNTSTSICTVVLTDTGTSSVAVTGCSVQLNGVAAASTAAPVAPSTTTVPASGSGTYTCTPTAPNPQTVGSMAIGHFSLANGASVPFSGTWS
jgi:hypothetical protein